MAGNKQCATRLRRLSCILCVATYLFGGLEIVPQFLALGAWLEGSHSVRIAMGGDRVTIVLSHAQAQLNQVRQGNDSIPVHRHGPAARIICVFASSQTTSDHVAQFNPTQLSESAQGLAKAAPERRVCQSPVSLCSEKHQAFSRSSLPAASLAPRLSDCLDLLHSTVLII